MKPIAVILILALLCGLCAGCADTPQTQIAATTMPVYCFTQWLCRGTGLTVVQLVTEEVSCLHDYSLTVTQMKTIESAELVIISGAGLEEFMHEALESAHTVADASAGVPLLEGSCHHHEESDHPDEHNHEHEHETDPHIWLDPDNAQIMARNIFHALAEQYPQHQAVLEENFNSLSMEIDQVKQYAQTQLSGLSSRKIITFHDGFTYLAHAFDLEILEAIEEESGSEPSAQELIALIETLEHHGVCAIFTEANGSSSAASVISRESGIPVFVLTMAMSGESWFDCMYQNIDTLKEALS